MSQNCSTKISDGPLSSDRQILFVFIRMAVYGKCCIFDLTFASLCALEKRVSLSAHFVPTATRSATTYFAVFVSPAHGAIGT